MTGEEDCLVTLRKSAFIQLSARIDIAASTFYDNDGETSFIDNICAFLGIDTGRLKIVGIYEGSVYIEAQISTDESQNLSHDEEYEELASLEERLNSDDEDVDVVGSPIITSSVSMYVFNDDGSFYTPSDEEEEKEVKKSNNVIIFAVAGAGVLIIFIAIIGVLYWRRTRAKIHDSGELSNKSSINRETIKVSTDFDFSNTE